MQQLRSPEIVHDAKTLINQLWELPAHSTFLPCCNPTSLLKHNVATLQSQPYFVGEKTDGVRMFLLVGFTRNSEEEYSVLIDRAYRMYRVALEAPAEMYCGTLLDGEYIEASNRYVLFDAIASRGYKYSQQTHSRRIAEVRRAASSITFLSPALTLSVKSWYPFHQTDEWRHLKTINDCDGLIFSPENYALKAGQHPYVFKWKSDHTLDFVLSVHRDDTSRRHPRLFFTDRGVPVDATHHGFVLVRSGELYELAIDRVPCLVECSIDIVDATSMHCHVVRLRTDKTTPNDLRTVRSTVRNIQESITFTSLQRSAKKVR